MTAAAAPAGRLLLARHGQSTTNAANIFTGITDPPLTERGVMEAQVIADALLERSISPNVVFTSGLQRAIRTAEIIIERTGGIQRPIASEALNERDYGDLTGREKSDIAAQFGEEQLTKWRRSYAEAPPGGESLRETAARVLAYYIQAVLPPVLDGGTVLIVAHGNSLRALIMALDGLTPEQVEKVEIGTGAVLVYDFSADSRVLAKSLLVERQGAA